MASDKNSPHVALHQATLIFYPMSVILRPPVRSRVTGLYFCIPEAVAQLDWRGSADLRCAEGLKGRAIAQLRSRSRSRSHTATGFFFF